MAQTQQPDSAAGGAIPTRDFGSILDHLDNFGLTPVQFRVYCHLLRSARDGVVSESSESIAKVCKLTRVTVIRVLSQLSQMNLIQCDRAAGKKSVFYLMPFSNWRSPAPQAKKQTNTQHSRVVQLRVSENSKSNSDTCKTNEPIKQINTQQAREEYPMGYSSLAHDMKVVNEIDQLNSDTRLNSGTDSLDEKLAAARLRGWWDAGTWWNDAKEQMVSVNRFVVSVADFMQRSLDSFDVERQVCAEGLRMCREQIAKIKRRSHQQREQVVAIA